MIAQDRISSNSRSGEAGSALFLILIGVILFAALSYTVANIMRTGNPNMVSDEKASLYANEIIDFGRNLRQAAQGLKINGCADTGISFENPVLAGVYAHMPAASDECIVFGTNGAGMNYLQPSPDWLDADNTAEALYGQWYFPANVCAVNVGTGGAACATDTEDNEDLVVIMPYIKESICTKINEGLGYGATIPVEAGNAWPSAGTKFTGTYADGESIAQSGHLAGCFEGSTTNSPPDNTYHFFQVVLAR